MATTTTTTTFTSPAEAEQLARQFAKAWPVPNVRRAVALAEAGTLAWEDVAALFARVFSEAREEVQN